MQEPKIGLLEQLYLPAIVGGPGDDGEPRGQDRVRRRSDHAAVPGAAAEAAGQLPRRPSAQPRRGRPRQVRGLLHVFDGVPGPLHRHRGGAVAVARPREVSGDVRHRRAALHLLRHVRAGVPGGRHRADDAVRPDRPEPRGDDVRQGEAAERLRPDGEGGDRPGAHDARRAGRRPRSCRRSRG